MLNRTPSAPEGGQRGEFKAARIQARRQELLIAYGQFRGAVQALAAQKATAFALTNEIRAEIGAKAAKQLFLEVGFPFCTSPDKWMRAIDDQILTHIAALPYDPLTTDEQRFENLAHGEKASGKRAARGRRPTNPDLLTAEQACELLGGITPAGLYKGIKEKRFPKPLKIGPQTARWLRSECNDVLNRRAQERT
jgi:predicted DNA-binding transcriptional regulator AlpA